jgi:fermentation-respiration switch protein FrsA (DUF1100 family)
MPFSQVNVLAYDYEGYGHSTGQPSEEGAQSDVIAAYEYLRTRLGIKASNIYLFGRSLGGGPTIYLARELARRKKDDIVAGVILQVKNTLK